MHMFSISTLTAGNIYCTYTGGPCNQIAGEAAALARSKGRGPAARRNEILGQVHEPLPLSVRKRSPLSARAMVAVALSGMGASKGQNNR